MHVIMNQFLEHRMVVRTPRHSFVGYAHKFNDDVTVYSPPSPISFMLYNVNIFLIRLNSLVCTIKK
jgi:hypothetical protein